MDSFKETLDLLSKAQQVVRSDYHMNLGELISFLEGVEPSFSIIFESKESSPQFIEGVSSYRGYYEDLALIPSDEKEECKLSVEELLHLLRRIVDTTMEGYKGGDYLMTTKTPLWISPVGDCSQLAVTGATTYVDAKLVSLITKHI